jgi:phosphoribosyl 1,2-cyclic phosphodiesterase
VRIRLWGTRGSLASPGPATVRYGGNTACVEVRADDGTLLILDAGTGIRALGETIPRETRRLDMLLTHLHMDHIQGLGFFEPFHRPDLEVHIWGPPSTTLDLRTRLTRYLSPPLFPVRLRDMGATMSFHDVPAEPFSVGGFEIRGALISHPGATVGYRIAENGSTLAYLPDHEPALGVRDFPEDPAWTSGFDLAVGAEVLIHDSQYTEAEYPDHVGWGHSSIPQALAFARLAGVEQLVTFHHSPDRSDAEIDRILAEARDGQPFDIVGGAEGLRTVAD